MDSILGVSRYSNSMKIQKQISTNSNKRRRSSKDIKVVYISSPMKVKTSASEFRALVQELTGRHSDTARFMEMTSTTSSTTTSSNSPKQSTLFASDNSHDEDVEYHNQQQQQQQQPQQLKGFDHNKIYNYLNNHEFPFSNYDQSPNTTSQPLFQSMFDDNQHFNHLIDDDVFVSNSYIIDSVM